MTDCGRTCEYAKRVALQLHREACIQNPLWRVGRVICKSRTKWMPKLNQARLG